MPSYDDDDLETREEQNKNLLRFLLVCLFIGVLVVVFLAAIGLL